MKSKVYVFGIFLNKAKIGEHKVVLAEGNPFFQMTSNELLKMVDAEKVRHDEVRILEEREGFL